MNFTVPLCVCVLFVGIRWICRQVLLVIPEMCSETSLVILNVNVRVAVMWSAGQGELVSCWSKANRTSVGLERRPGTNASWSNGLLCVLIVIRWYGQYSEQCGYIYVSTWSQHIFRKLVNFHSASFYFFLGLGEVSIYKQINMLLVGV